MDGLRKFTGIVAIFCLMPAVTISALANDGRSEDTCAVIGDVARPNTFRCEADQPLSLNAALDAAQMISENSNVLLIRASGSQQWTEVVSRGSTVAGPVLMRGDVIVVSAVGQTRTGFQPNAVLIEEGRPVVLALQTSSSVPVVVADVLLNCQLPLNRVVDVQLISAKPGRSRRSVQPAFEVEHGDVLMLAAASIRPTRAGTGFRPMVSEWSGENSGAAENRTAEASVNPELQSSLDASASMSPGIPETPGPVDAGGVLSTSSPALAIPQPFPAAFSGSAGGSAGDPELEPDHPDQQESVSGDLSVQMVSSQYEKKSGKAFPSISSGADIAELSSILPVAASLQENAPVPPRETPAAAEVATGMNGWSLAFIGGLLVAGGLIVFGWLKSEAEMRAQRTVSMNTLRGSSPESVSVADNHSRSLSQIQPLKAVSGKDSESVDHSQKPASPKIDTEPPVQLSKREGIVVSEPTAVELVQKSEWFGGDWIRPSSQPVTPNAGGDGSRQEAAIASEVSIAQVQPVSVPPVSVSPVSHQSVSTVTTQMAAVPLPVSAEGQATEIFSDLNDLIANRLPVDLCEARLPLRVSLFGRPAGPRRLRIDAGHTQLAGPHMSMNADRRRSNHSVTATVASSAGGLSAGGLNTGTQAGSAHPSESKEKLEAGPGISEPVKGMASLDRALNFLHEQGE